jgi:ankyrin repeat protein
MRAVEFGNIEVVKGLMKAGANTTMKNNYGQNAVTLAEQMVAAQRNEEKVVVNKQILDIVNRRG